MPGAIPRRARHHGERGIIGRSDRASTPRPTLFSRPISPWPGWGRVPGIPDGRFATACEAMNLVAPPRCRETAPPFTGQAADGRPRRPAGPVGPGPLVSPIFIARPPRRRGSGPNGPKERVRAAVGAVEAACGNPARYRERIGRRSRRSVSCVGQPPLFSRRRSGGRRGVGASLRRRCGMRGCDRPVGSEPTSATVSIGGRFSEVNSKIVIISIVTDRF